MTVIMSPVERLRQKLGIRDHLTKCALSEFVCTAFLMFVGFSINAQKVIARTPSYDMLGGNFAWGLALFFSVQMGFGIWSFRRSSKSFGVFHVLLLWHYWFGQGYTAAQFLGSFLGAAMAFTVYYDGINAMDGGIRMVYGVNATAGIFSTYPKDFMSVQGAIIDQISCTAVMVVCVLGRAQ
ncbi:hypothetical protein L596_030708 [Steinernema carpocapsae]|uniref:Aquaporin n=1 Tax=Steinernema carpocapsae TaxID=34508 RepID=A0A4U5LNI3_STECR|nr:hypothetical protein L596_030708 [Steinernema carpocapsae]